MKIVPKVVKNLNELEDALKAKEKVILVSNTELINPLKNKVAKISNRRKNTTKGIIGGISMMAAGVLVGVFAPCVIAGVIAGATISTVGIYLTGGSIILKSINFFKGHLKNYTYMETNDKSILILIKEKGNNSFDFVNDIINYD